MVQSFATLLKLFLTSLLPAHRLLVEYSDPARAGGSLAVVDPTLGTLTDLHTPFTSFGSLSVAQVNHSCDLHGHLTTCCAYPEMYRKACGKGHPQ